MGSEARARLGLWFLLTVALFSFGQLFASGDYPGPAILGMLLATGIVVGLRRLGFGAAVATLASGAALAWYLSLVFQARHTLWSLPTPASLSALLGSVRRAIEHSQIDYAPVPLRPGYAIIVVAALWVATTIGEIATFRWRRPIAASLMPIVIFAVALTVGTGTGGAALAALFLAALLTYWGLESSHRTRAWGRWVSAWAHHEGGEPQSITGDLARRLGAAAIAAAMVSPMFLPQLENSLFSWRSGVGPDVGGGEGGGRVNPWVSIVPDIPNQTTEVLFTVEASAAEYWRLSSLEVFNGSDWSESVEERINSQDGAIVGPAVPLTASQPLDQTVEIEGLRGDLLPAALAAATVTRLGSDGSASTEGIDFDPDSGAVFVDDDLEEGDRYRITSTTPSVRFADLIDAQPGRPGTSLDDAYFQLPARLGKQADEMVRGWISEAKAETPFEELIAVQAELRSFEYTLEPATPEGPDLVSDFLVRTREGFCQQFATAFAVIARQLGYPSRVSVGFLPGEPNELNATYTVKGTDAHAWPEVYFEGFGWIKFEPTPRSESFAPEYTLEPAGGGANGGAPNLNNPFSDLGGRGGGAFDDAPGGAIGNAPLPNPREQAPGAGRGSSGAPRGTPQWQKTFAALLTALVIAMFLFLASMPAVKEWRIRKRYARAAGPDGLAVAAFTQFEDEAAELAEPRSPAESAASFARRMATSRVVAERSATRLADIYEAAAYAADDITPEQAAEARRLARALRAQLWHKASWWARLTRLFSPKRLLPS